MGLHDSGTLSQFTENKMSTRPSVGEQCNCCYGRIHQSPVGDDVLDDTACMSIEEMERILGIWIWWPQTETGGQREHKS